jgi:hypothetical protein
MYFTYLRPMRLRPKAIKAGSKIYPACAARNAATSSTRAFARKENASAAVQARQGRDRGWPRAVLRLLLYRSGLRSPETRVFPRLAGDHHVNMHEGRGGVLLMWAFIVAIIVFGLTQVISILVLFRYGMSDNQTLPPSTAAETTSTVGTLIAFAIAASHWLPQLGW